MSFLSTAVSEVLDAGDYCWLAVPTVNGPHCTPLVFAYSGGRIWLTTSRRSIKARAWKTGEPIGGMVRAGLFSVTFEGSIEVYDALDSSTWGSAVSGATAIARATSAFSRKNARFFAGTVTDTKQVPFAWTPPGRVFAAVNLERVALIDEDSVQEGRGRRKGQVLSAESFKKTKQTHPVMDEFPDEISEALGSGGQSAIALETDSGPAVLPARWASVDGTLYSALPSEVLELSGVASGAAASITLDRPAAFKAGAMTGAMIQGTASIFVPDQLKSGAKSAAALAAEIYPAATAGSCSLVRVEPTRAVWWKGWASGTIDL